jgi:diguanylate cyclase (GGDEF)-like protein
VQNNVQRNFTVSNHGYMKIIETDPNAELPHNAKQQKSLTHVLAESEHVKMLVKESAEELSSVNADIKQELANQGSLPGVENALEKSEAVEDKVQEASDKLSEVNQALKGEVKERHVLEGKLAAVTEQGRVDRRAALHDLLTGLPNRALFYDRLEHGFQHAKRHGWTLAVMFVDLDDFKSINDMYGHDAGDSLLQAIAGRLKENTRGEDTVSRHGGDEFLILINEVREETNISLIAEKVIMKIQAPCNIRTRDFTVVRSITASIGISVFPKDGSTADALVTSADRAMYIAKRNKSGYSFAR